MLYRQYINNNNQVSMMRHPTNVHVDFTFIKPDRESCVFASLSKHTKIVMEGDKMLSWTWIIKHIRLPNCPTWSRGDYLIFHGFQLLHFIFANVIILTFSIINILSNPSNANLKSLNYHCFVPPLSQCCLHAFLW